MRPSAAARFGFVVVLMLALVSAGCSATGRAASPQFSSRPTTVPRAGKTSRTPHMPVPTTSWPERLPSEPIGYTGSYAVLGNALYADGGSNTVGAGPQPVIEISGATGRVVARSAARPVGELAAACRRRVRSAR